MSNNLSHENLNRAFRITKTKERNNIINYIKFRNKIKIKILAK